MNLKIKLSDTMYQQRQFWNASLIQALTIGFLIPELENPSFSVSCWERYNSSWFFILQGRYSPQFLLTTEIAITSTSAHWT